MKLFSTKLHMPAVLCTVFLLALLSCNKDEEEVFPITNDLRVLKVSLGSRPVNSGATGLSVIPEFEFVFSHGLNTSSFEQALSISPGADLAVRYDDTRSFATIFFNTPLEYSTAYSLELPQGAYGANGEATTEDYVFNFTTAPFEPPVVTLTADASQFFEGESITVTATLNRAILREVSMDVVFGGSAEQDADYTASAASLTIPSGATSASLTITALEDGGLEGEETLTVALENLSNAVQDEGQVLELALGDTPPALEIKGVMELDNYIGGSDGRVRAVHLRVLEDIADLSVYGVEIASNGATPDPNDIDFIFPAGSAVAGEELFIVRDQDVANAEAYFGDCFADFTVFPTGAMTQNGDDAVLLYKNGVAIESFGEPGVDGTGAYWEYTDSWAYKLGDEWIYAGVACVENAAGGETNATNACPYPFCTPLQLQGVSALLWDGSGTNGGKFVQVRANRDIADLSVYSLGVANNGGGTDGIEFTFPAISVSEGDQILVAREPETIATYLGSCFNRFAHVIQSDAMNQNGDDAIELFLGMEVIETFGDANVDGTGQFWDYDGAWGYKIGSSWTYGGVDCAAGATSNQGSACPYPLCN